MKEKADASGTVTGRLKTARNIRGLSREKAGEGFLADAAFDGAAARFECSNCFLLRGIRQYSGEYGNGYPL